MDELKRNLKRLKRFLAMGAITEADARMRKIDFLIQASRAMGKTKVNLGRHLGVKEWPVKVS